MTFWTGYAVRRATEDLARSALPDAPVRPEGKRGAAARVQPRAASLPRSLAERIESESRELASKQADGDLMYCDHQMPSEGGPMTTHTTISIILETYPNAAVARKVLKGLTTAGVPERNVRLLIGARVHDVRNEPVGGFARLVTPDAPVGTYGNAPRLRWQGAGSFAGNPDRQRQGSFADTDRTTIIGYQGGAERAQATGNAQLRALLRGAGLDDTHAGRVLEELHEGRAVVLAHVAPAVARASLEQVALAA